MRTYIGKTAALSDDGVYRYSLYRRWSGVRSHLLWVMLNPSTADADRDDNTVATICRYSEAWGHGAVWVVNLFAYRATRPSDLRSASDPIGPDNDSYIHCHASWADGIVAAWGTQGTYLNRDRQVLTKLHRIAALRRIPVSCLVTTKDGHPHHPLRLASDIALRAYP